MRIPIEHKVLAHHDQDAAFNRLLLKGLPCINLMSSPGAGKTRLLEWTCRNLGNLRVGLIAGDPYTANDANRLRKAGARRVHSIETAGACHLEAAMIRPALEALDLDALDLVIVENVGNLICPAAYDLGESSRVVLLSLTEGEGKPLKYPVMFRKADLMLLNKCDLAEVLECDPAVYAANARAVHPDLEILPVSCQTETGLNAWLAWLEALVGKGIAVG